MKELFTKKNVVLFFMVIANLAWLGLVFQNEGIISRPSLLRDYPIYEKIAKSGMITLGMLGIATLMSGAKYSVRSSDNISTPILAGAGLLLALVCFINLTANPDGRYPWKSGLSYVRVGARPQKMDIYMRQNQTAQILILGSSRSFALSSKTLDEKYDMQAFNMGVEIGDTTDFLAFTRFVLDHQQEPPLLMIIEVGPSTFEGNSELEKTPLQMIPYLPASKITPALWSILKTLFMLSTFTDSIYHTGVILQENQPRFKFLADGTLPQPPVDMDKYQDTWQKQAKSFRKMDRKTLPIEKSEELKALIALAKQKEIAIVFYSAPLTGDLLKDGRIQKTYRQYDRAIKTFLSSMQKEQENVFFVDVASRKQISNLRHNGFIDGFHLTDYGAEKVIERLNPAIQSALQWAEQARQK